MPEPPTQPLRLTRAHVREIDRRSIEQYHIPGVVLMENAARAVTDAAMDMLPTAGDGDVVIVCGGGNNGGDGLAVARHLHNRRVRVVVALAANPDAYRNEAAVNWKIVRAMQIPLLRADAANSLAGHDFRLVIDALFGTGLSSPPRENSWIAAINHSRVAVLAVDLPSGLDCDTGEPLGPACVRATRTVTFVAEKAGFANPNIRRYLGEVTVGDIGCPRELLDAVAQNFPGPPDVT